VAKKKLSEELIGFELEALSLLLHYWALPFVVKKRTANWKDKFPKFRSAVIAGMGKGFHEKLTPRELVFSEYKEIYESLKWLRKECENYKMSELASRLAEIPIIRELTCNGKPFFIDRPIPVVIEDADKFCRKLLGRKKEKKELSDIAYEIVGKRLQCSPKKVKDSTLEENFKRAKVNKEQGFLISAFIDICSLPEKDFRRDMLAKILNALFETKCHVLILCYLLRKAHAIKTKPDNRLSVGEYKFEQVEDLCRAMTANSHPLSYRPFLRLIPA
jgi:hypothetical protein